MVPTPQIATYSSKIDNWRKGKWSHGGVCLSTAKVPTTKTHIPIQVCQQPIPTALSFGKKKLHMHKTGKQPECKARYLLEVLDCWKALYVKALGQISVLRAVNSSKNSIHLNTANKHPFPTRPKPAQSPNCKITFRLYQIDSQNANAPIDCTAAWKSWSPPQALEVQGVQLSMSKIYSAFTAHAKINVPHGVTAHTIATV